MAAPASSAPPDDRRTLAHHAHVYPPDQNAGATVDRLLTLLDACDIDQAVTFAPFAHQSPVGFDCNGWLAGAVPAEGRGRLYGFGTIDPRRDDTADQVRRARDLGLLGLKIHPNAQHCPILSDACVAACETAAELGMLVTFHCGVHQSRMRDTDVLLFDELAWRVPTLRFSLEHVGGYHFFPLALAVLFNHYPPPWSDAPPRLFAGLASVFTPDHNAFWHLPDDRLKEIARQITPRQMIFGLDFPYNLEPQTLTALRTIRERLDLSPADQALVLGGNLRRVLGLA